MERLLQAPLLIARSTQEVVEFLGRLTAARSRRSEARRSRHSGQRVPARYQPPSRRPHSAQTAIMRPRSRAGRSEKEVFDQARGVESVHACTITTWASDDLVALKVAREEDIGPGASLYVVASGTPGDQIIALAAQDHVVARAAVDRVVPGTCRNRGSLSLARRRSGRLPYSPTTYRSPDCLSGGHYRHHRP